MSWSRIVVAANLAKTAIVLVEQLNHVQMFITNRMKSHLHLLDLVRVELHCISLFVVGVVALFVREPEVRKVRTMIVRRNSYDWVVEALIQGPSGVLHLIYRFEYLGHSRLANRLWLLNFGWLERLLFENLGDSLVKCVLNLLGGFVLVLCDVCQCLLLLVDGVLSHGHNLISVGVNRAFLLAVLHFGGEQVVFDLWDHVAIFLVALNCNKPGLQLFNLSSDTILVGASEVGELVRVTVNSVLKTGLLLTFFLRVVYLLDVSSVAR